MDLSQLIRMPFYDKPADSAGGEDQKPADGTGDELEDAGKQTTFTPEQQKLINELIGKTRKEEREKLQKAAEAKAAKDKEEADKQKLQEQGEFKKLADTAEKKAQEAEARAKAAEAKASRLELQRRFEATVKELKLEFVSPTAAEDAFAHLKAEDVGDDFKGLPEAVKKLAEERDYLFGDVSQTVRTNIDATAKGKPTRTAVKQKTIDTKRKSYSPL